MKRACVRTCVRVWLGVVDARGEEDAFLTDRHRHVKRGGRSAHRGVGAHRREMRWKHTTETVRESMMENKEKKNKMKERDVKQSTACVKRMCAHKRDECCDCHEEAGDRRESALPMVGRCSCAGVCERDEARVQSAREARAAKHAVFVFEFIVMCGRNMQNTVRPSALFLWRLSVQ